LQAQIDAAVGTRYDSNAARAKALAAEAWALHQAGKHAESVAKYDEAAKSGWHFATPAHPAGGNANVFDAHAEASPAVRPERA